MKIKKSYKLAGLGLTILLGVLFGGLVQPAVAITSGNVIGTDLIINTVRCFYPELNQNAIGFYLESVWLGDNQCVDDVSTWNDFIGGEYPYPVHIKLIEGNTVNLNTYCPSLTPEQCQASYGLSPMGAATVYETTLPTPTPATSDSPSTGTINVTKIVINDSGKTKTIADFPLFVNGKKVISGVTNSFPAPGPVLTVTETKDSNYTQSFSGDCDTSGQMDLSPGDNKFCIVTNNDIGAPVVVPLVPPLIDIVKVPNPLALPDGPGPVTYTYTLRNIGTVPVFHITLVGDTCSPIVLVSGDTNGDSQLDVSEKWTYRCTTRLTETHTNTITAIGWANNISDIDVATSTVTVGTSSKVPPLIHVIKIPNTLVLPAGGGMVTYTNIVTNPGTVPLNYVSLNDEQSSPMKYVSGDSNKDLQLDINEAWTYISRRNLTETTTNTVSARGEANGLIARDFSVATVVVPATEVVPDNVVPALPDTGPLPDNTQPAETQRTVLWNIIILAGVITTLIIIFFLNKNKKI